MHRPSSDRPSTSRTSPGTGHRPARRTACLAGVAVAAVALAGLQAGPASADRTVDPSGAPTTVAGVSLDAATIPQLQALIAAGRLSSVDLTTAYLGRIKTVDASVNAVLSVNGNALRDAAASDRHRRDHGRRSLLEGIPVLLKDNVDTLALPTTAGSRALLGARPARNATLAQRLVDAGAIVIGKANLSEWANYRSTRSTSGWSAVGGLTRNPYALDRNACGSSSGSAAGVAASLAQVAIGTETDGSIVCPSGSTGVVGLKPTLGLVSRSGVVPISAEQDTAGPMARHVVDAAITLDVIAGRDGRDAATLAAPRDLPRARDLDADALRGARVGLWRIAGQDAGADAVVERAAVALRRAGATVVPVRLDDFRVFDDEGTALASEFRRDLEAYLAATPGTHPRTLAGLVRFNRQDSLELRYFGQELFLASLAAPPADDPSVVAARQRARSTARSIIDSALREGRLDAVVAPTNARAWVTTLGEGDAFSGPSSSTLPAVSGYPNVTVPGGLANGLPIGISFLGGRWDDAQVMDLAYSFEQATKARRAPTYRASLGR